jgi:hypothetical protein
MNPVHTLFLQDTFQRFKREQITDIDNACTGWPPTKKYVEVKN